jgi:hypothetical protein
MVPTRAAEDATPDIPEGSAGHECGRGQAPHGNPLPSTARTCQHRGVAGNSERANEGAHVE